MSTILVVDDSPDVLHLLRLALRKSDRYIITAGNGQEALDTLACTLPDLVITDIHMPVMDGLQLIERIRGRYGSSLPIVVISGESSPTQRRAALRLGADEFVRKPFVLGTMRLCIEELLSGRNRTGSTGEPGHPAVDPRHTLASVGQGA